MHVAVTGGANGIGRAVAEQVDTAMIDGKPRPKLLAQITPDDVAKAIAGAVEHNRFEVWVPRSQGASAKLSALLPRAAREAILRALGVGRIAGDYDRSARSGYHEKRFGRS